MAEPDNLHGSQSLEAIYDIRCAEYQKVTIEEENALNFFDDIGNHAMWLDITNDATKQMETSMMTVTAKIGKAHNYGRTLQEKGDLLIEKDAARLQKALKDSEAKLIRQRDPRNSLQMAQWKKDLLLLKLQDHGKWQLATMPMQQYLMTYVLPTVHDGMVECARVKPESLIDHMAEYLLRKVKPDASLKAELTEEQGAATATLEPQVGAGDNHHASSTSREMVADLDVSASKSSEEELLISAVAHQVFYSAEEEKDAQYFISAVAHGQLVLQSDNSEGEQLGDPFLLEIKTTTGERNQVTTAIHVQPGHSLIY